MSKITEIKEITKLDYVTVGYGCDNCGFAHNGADMPDTWHIFSASHREWGNDSYESTRDFMVCSPICYFDQLGVAIHDFSDYRTTEIDGLSLAFAKGIVELNRRGRRGDDTQIFDLCRG